MKKKKKKQKQLSHLDARGHVHMVDVGEKKKTDRVAVARALVHVSKKTAKALAKGKTPKGDVLAVARIAGIQAAKRTSEWIPLCHPIALTRVAIEIEIGAESELVEILATTETHDRTGVEMEAMVAASAAALTLYDMLKGIERGIHFEVALIEKSGGQSGSWRA